MYANGTSLFTRAYELRMKGVDLRQDASQLVTKVGELEKRLEMVQRDLEMITGKSDEAEEKLGALYHSMAKLPNGKIITKEKFRKGEIYEEIYPTML